MTTLREAQDQAERLIDLHFDMQDPRSARQMDIHARKLADAERFLAVGTTSDLLNEEAKLRGVSTGFLAKEIVARASKFAGLELQRVQAKIAVRACQTRGQIIDAMDSMGIMRVPSAALDMPDATPVQPVAPDAPLT